MRKDSRPLTNEKPTHLFTTSFSDGVRAHTDAQMASLTGRTEPSMPTRVGWQNPLVSYTPRAFIDLPYLPT